LLNLFLDIKLFHKTVIPDIVSPFSSYAPQTGSIQSVSGTLSLLAVVLNQNSHWKTLEGRHLLRQRYRLHGDHLKAALSLS
jgi:hypothetical protein